MMGVGGEDAEGAGRGCWDGGEGMLKWRGEDVEVVGRGR